MKINTAMNQGQTSWLLTIVFSTMVLVSASEAQVMGNTHNPGDSFGGQLPHANAQPLSRPVAVPHASAPTVGDGIYQSAVSDQSQSSEACQCAQCQQKSAEEAEAAIKAADARQAKIQSQLTGDWFGRRSALEDRGIAVRSSLTQFYQGVASGGTEQRFSYAGKLNTWITADTEKLGWWKGGTIESHVVDWQFGQNAISDAVAFAPVNLALLTPEPQNSFAVTSLVLTQALGGGFVASAGRINLPDFWAGLYPDYGLGLDGFMNLSLAFPLNIVPTFPLITNGLGVEKVGEKGAEAAFFVFESQNSPTTVGWDFPNGVTMLALGRKYSQFFNQPGTHTLIGSYATGDYTSFNQNGWVVQPGGVVIPASKRGSWVAGYIGEQQLWADPCNPKRRTKLFGNVGFSDTENSPFEWTGLMGLETFGPLADRASDRAGIAYFFNSLNFDFQQLVSNVIPIEAAHGAELYYNAEISPWFHLTLDLQAINPEVRSQDTAVVLGLRGKIDF